MLYHLSVIIYIQSRRKQILRSDKVSYNKSIALVITLELASGFNANKINYLLLLVSCGIIVSSCGTSLLNELHDYNKHADLFHSGPYS